MVDAHKFFNSYGKKVIFKIRPCFLFQLCCSKPLVKWLKWLDISPHMKQLIWEHRVEQLLFNHSIEILLCLVYFVSFNSIHTTINFTVDLLCAVSVFQTHEAFTSQKMLFLLF